MQFSAEYLFILFKISYILLLFAVFYKMKIFKISSIIFIILFFSVTKSQNLASINEVKQAIKLDLGIVRELDGFLENRSKLEEKIDDDEKILDDLIIR